MIKTSSGALFSEGKVLLVKRNPDALRFPNSWACPGGRAEKGETPEQTVIREVKEETNLDFEPTQLFMTGRMDERVMNRFLGDWKGDIVLQAEELCDFGWFNYKDCAELDFAFDYREVIDVLFAKGLLK